jgi:exosortase
MIENSSASSRTTLYTVLACAGVLLFFYLGISGYGPGRLQSLFEVLYDSWNEETRYEHGPFYPIIIIGLFIYRWKDIRNSVGRGETRGLALVALGILFYLLAHRVIQWRVGMGALPFMLHGAVWYLWGRKTALITAFPIYYIWLSVPLPDVQQATVPMQNLSIKISQSICGLLGVDTIAEGSKISPVDKSWKEFEIAESCSGIRSLMALLMISSAWAYATSGISLAKRAMLLLSALPLAIIGNGLRVSSIFLIAHYGSEEFARKTWHDNSGLLLFYPISLISMMALQSLFQGNLPWKKKVVRRQSSDFKTQPSEVSEL